MKNLKIIQYMQGFSDGVIYYSPTGTMASKTTLTSNGSVKNEIVKFEIPMLPNNFIASKELEDKFKYSIAFLIDASLMLLASYLKNIPFFVWVCIFAFFVSLKLFKLIHTIIQIKMNKKYKSLARFVAASHMATNAYLRLQRIPTLAEAKKCSRFSTDSQVIFTFAKILTYLSGGLVFLLLPSSFSWIIFIILSILIYGLTVTGIFNFLQIFITSKPFDEELNVAIRGIKSFEEMEDIVNNEL